MIAYFDTSAIIPLLIGEPTTDRCTRLWNDATRIVCARLVYPEACAALSRAVRMGRISPAQAETATAELDDLAGQIDFVEITDDLARSAGRLARRFGLRGYDAVHLAAGITINDDQAVFVTADADLADAAANSGLAVAVPAAPPTT